MPGKLLTTYLSNEKNIPDGFTKILIMRNPFPSVRLLNDKRISPPEWLRIEYRMGQCTWESFKFTFNKYLRFNEKGSEAVREYYDRLQSGENICFICCEKSNNKCHRRLLGEHYQELGIEWEELEI